MLFGIRGPLLSEPVQQTKQCTEGSHGRRKFADSFVLTSHMLPESHALLCKSRFHSCISSNKYANAGKKPQNLTT